ncbi:hypothetical protein BDB00DRAFT_771179 [Zychaea mexicana]|uniref:uncharacterized protein n=1 Tax=Zychaea mexicana TaxID=64656 RepID=UPI0022FEB6FD|nr:uncharacterized protein BDB00DRAFT_771179 [Zychaea mexicana]KAI9489150.1 hypothetical protein BDB00DRAFT_771179 [Zychaea mexicana]
MTKHRKTLKPGEADHRRPSEAATLVDEALGRREARGRHIQFADHITESMTLIHGILNDQEHCASGGSVLGSLLRLEAQLQSAQTRLEPRARKDSHHHREDRRRVIAYYTQFSPIFNHPSPAASDTSLEALRKRPRAWLTNVTSSSHLVPSLQTRKREISSRKREQDSLFTTSSQFEPISVEDRVRIAFEIANILQRQQFLRKLTKALMLYGCPAHRLEYILKHVSDTLKVDAEFVYLPNIMLMTFFDPETHTTETHFIRQSLVFDMHKLGEIYRLEKLVGHGEVTVDEALEFIDRVADEPQFYPSWLNPFIYAIISVCGSVMFFGGRWKEAGLSAGLAMFFALYELFSERFWGFRPIWEVTVCIVIGFVSRASTKFGFCFIPTAFSSFIVILPGYYMAIAVIELISRQMVSGIVRTGYAIIFSFLLGYGVSMGSALYRAIDPNTPTDTAPDCQLAANANTCIVSESQYYHFLTVPVFSMAYCLLLRARLPRWPTVIFVSVCGFAVNWLLSCIASAPSQVIQVVPAFAVGLIGNILTKITSKMSFDAVLVAVFYLVPGSLGLKAAIGIFSGQESAYGSQGASFALSMIETCIGIAVGLGIANLIVYPKGAQRTPLLNM